MTSHRLPNYARDTVPAVIEQGRAMDFPYRGGAMPELEPREPAFMAELRPTLDRLLDGVPAGDEGLDHLVPTAIAQDIDAGLLAAGAGRIGRAHV